MTTWLLVTQIILYLASICCSVFHFVIDDDVDKNLYLRICAFALILVNVTLSVVFAWCGLTIALLISSSVLLLANLTENDSMEPSFSFIVIGQLFTVLVIILLIISIFAPFEMPSDIHSRNEETTVEICSVSDKGISDTSIYGKSNLLFGTVGGSTTLNYYYAYYYLNDNGSLSIGSIPADKTELFPISDNEQAYVKIYKEYNKNQSLISGFLTDTEYLKSIRYELYAPESSIPTTFNFNLE